MSRILAQGRNCWRVERAQRAALLVDGDAYFSTLRRAAQAARRSIFIVGWDFDSRIEFPPGRIDDGLPPTLGAFLDALARATPTLHICVLNWDFAMLYALDREFLPIYSLGWRTHGRLHFELDGRHPPGASHHQKMVVIDDALAFVGGLDLAKGRWDTPRHAPEEPRRRNPGGSSYPPFHDTQLMVDGAAAAALGELARRRWRRAGGADPPRSQAAPAAELWPDSIEPDFEEVDVGIARTEPPYEGAGGVHEVRELYLDALRAAERSVYMENQYFAAQRVAAALTEGLAAPQGPEVVVVTRRRGGGWLEQNTMEVLRARLLKRLEPQDPYHRLRVYCPEQEGLGEACIDLHSKLMIVDERLLRVGSANLNNRSMGLDTECDLAIEAGSAQHARAIASIRERLLAEHLGVERDEVARAIGRGGSLIGAIEALQGNARTLKRLEPSLDPQLDALVPDAEAIDWEKPVEPDRLVEQLVPEEERPRAGARLYAAGGMLLAAVALAIAWRWGPLQNAIDPETLAAAARALERSPWTPLWVLAAYVVAALGAMPITLLIFATAIAFGPWSTFGYALAGSVLGAGLGFALGRLLGRDAVRRFAGRRLNELSKRLGRGGAPAVALLRMLPIAPFTVVNLVAGASHLGARDFLLGTVLGMSPGILAVALFADRFVAVVLDPSPASIGVLALLVAALALAAFALSRRLRNAGGS